MLKAQTLIWLSLPHSHNLSTVAALSTKVLYSRMYSTKGGKDDENVGSKTLENNENTENSNKKQVINKLNALLKRMIEEDVTETPSTIKLARPTAKKIIARESKSEITTKQTVETKIVEAVKNVADGIGGNVKQTESELLSKLLSPVDEDHKGTRVSLSDIVKGMKIDRESKGPETTTRAQQVKALLQYANERGKKDMANKQSRTKPARTRAAGQDKIAIEVKRIDLFGAEPLGIFKPGECVKPQANINETWQTLLERDLRLVVTHPPQNYFQEMILWTEQGKLWKFPIDNEQDIDAEKDVYFADHVFLEKHLEPWCPQKGPIRHFMELVCVGLSKNPYLSVKAKKEHIEWYRDYFHDKNQLLKDVGAIAPDHQIGTKEIAEA